MANQRATKTEHPYKTVGSMLKQGQIKSPLFFYGRETYLIDWAVQALTEKSTEPALRELNVSKYKGGEIDFNTLKNQCETLPMMSEKRVVLVENFPLLEGKRQKNFSEQDSDALAAYLKALPDFCLLIFTAATADKRLKLYKAMEKAGACYDFCPLDKKLLSGFIAKRLKAAGKRSTDRAVEAFIDATGYCEKESSYTLYNLENDLKKAIAHCEGDLIRAEDFLGTTAGNIELDAFAMVDAMVRGRKEDAYRLLNNLFRSGESEFRILALICMQMETILTVKEMQEEGLRYDEICSKMGIHEFRIRKGAEAARRYSAAGLRRGLLHAYQIDKNVKNGVMDGKLGLELLIAEM